MTNRHRTIGIMFLVATGLVTLVNSEAQDAGINTNLETVETVLTVSASAGGIGADQENAVVNAIQLLQQNQLVRAETILDGVLNQFATLMSDSRHTYVCFSRTQDYRQFLKEIQAKKHPPAIDKVTRVHISLADALDTKAYIASSRKQWRRAIDYLHMEISYAPYSSKPHLEIGYILNIQGKPQQALVSYKEAYALATAHRATRAVQAAALRGIGSTQIELGNLDDAVASFKKSLEIQPQNKVALNELQYIDQVRGKRR